MVGVWDGDCWDPSQRFWGLEWSSQQNPNKWNVGRCSKKLPINVNMCAYHMCRPGCWSPLAAPRAVLQLAGFTAMHQTSFPSYFHLKIKIQINTKWSLWMFWHTCFVCPCKIVKWSVTRSKGTGYNRDLPLLVKKKCLFKSDFSTTLSPVVVQFLVDCAILHFEAYIADVQI